MIADNIRVKIQHANDIGLQLKSTIQDGKLIVKALSLDDKNEYQGELQPHPYIDFQDIQELIEAKKIKIVTKTSTLLKIKVGATPIQLICKEKINLENLSETFEKFMKSQLLMEKQMKEQKDELYEHKNLIAGLRRQIDELKLGQEEKNSKFQKFEQNFTLEKSDLENKIQQNMNEINKMKSEIENKFESIEFKSESYKNKINALKDEINTIKLENQKTSIDVFEHDRRLKQLKDEIKRISQKTISELEQHKNNVSQNKLSESLKIYENKIKLIEVYLSILIKVPHQLLYQLFQGFAASRQNEPIRSSKWSEQLKSNCIKINNNVVTKTKYTFYCEFCLLNASFSNTIKTKQSWAIKYNKLTEWNGLGVCLKSKMLEYNFNNQNIHWYKTGHGLYMIGSDGQCWSHSQQEFNDVNKSFKFGENDVVYVEYDPIDLKLRFSKNKIEYFEMSIMAPPQNDAYHPFVSLWEQNESVELIQPQQLNQ